LPLGRAIPQTAIKKSAAAAAAAAARPVHPPKNMK